MKYYLHIYTEIVMATAGTIKPKGDWKEITKEEYTKRIEEQAQSSNQNKDAE